MTLENGDLPSIAEEEEDEEEMEEEEEPFYMSTH